MITQRHGLPGLPGEMKLWAAVIRQAVGDLNGSSAIQGSKIGTSADLRRQAYCWFTTKRQGVGTLQWICDQLGLDIGYVRREAGILPPTT